MKWLLLRLIAGYQRILSPALPPSCRYEPTCSRYAVEAIERHGALRGTWLAVKRLVAHAYHKRDGETLNGPLPEDVAGLISPWRRVRL